MGGSGQGALVVALIGPNVAFANQEIHLAVVKIKRNVTKAIATPLAMATHPFGCG